MKAAVLCPWNWFNPPDTVLRLVEAKRSKTAAFGTLQEIQTDLAAEPVASWRTRSQDDFVETPSLLLRVGALEKQWSSRS